MITSTLTCTESCIRKLNHGDSLSWISFSNGSSTNDCCLVTGESEWNNQCILCSYKWLMSFCRLVFNTTARLWPQWRYFLFFLWPFSLYCIHYILYIISWTIVSCLSLNITLVIADILAVAAVILLRQKCKTLLQISPFKTPLKGNIWREMRLWLFIITRMQ